MLALSISLLDIMTLFLLLTLIFASVGVLVYVAYQLLRYPF